jgi:hypothetical protein
MEQKYIAMFLNPESWSDMRRFDFSSEIYVNLAYPRNADPDLRGQWPRRLQPGATEVLYNPNEIERIGANARDYEVVPMWWDQQ